MNEHSPDHFRADPFARAMILSPVWLSGVLLAMCSCAVTPVAGPKAAPVDAPLLTASKTDGAVSAGSTAAGSKDTAPMAAGDAKSADASDASAQANNPLASLKTVNFQNQYNGDLTGIDESANSVLFRAAIPFKAFGSLVIPRATLPVNTFPTSPDGDHETGLGDFNIFAAYLLDIGDPDLSFGIGPQLTVPTATKDETGSGKWSLGFANVLFSAKSKVVQYGYLLTWQASVAGDDDRDDVDLGAFQPFVFYQFGGGTYLRSTGVMTFDFEHNAYSIPIGLGIGQVIKTEAGVFNGFVEPQVTILKKGDGQPRWGIFAGINFQF